jgi:hypothetical protein|tara:strand:- start:9521 stop:10249 length:729 start_codon:yes stop_codon:yes gene_type:complete
MAAVAAVASVAVGVGKAVGGAVKAGKAHKEMRRARARKQVAKAGMLNAMANRAEITNPYAGVTDLSGLASDLSSQISNPYNQLSVSTAAAEMQIEEADISLANTLDTLEQTGASAGGATALAMAALKSKKGVAADISKQEADNAKLRAQGEAQMMREKVAATTRYQDVLITQGTRVEDSEIAGEIFQFTAQENRSNADVQMYSQQYQGFANQQSQSSLASAAGTGAMIAGIGEIAGGLLSSD